MDVGKGGFGEGQKESEHPETERPKVGRRTRTSAGGH